jgi:hypothetical protein
MKGVMLYFISEIKQEVMFACLEKTSSSSAASVGRKITLAPGINASILRRWKS